MKTGVVFPQTEFGNDPDAIRSYAQTIEGLGYNHILAYDHVLSADTTHRPTGMVRIRSSIRFTRSSCCSAFLRRSPNGSNWSAGL